MIVAHVQFGLVGADGFLQQRLRFGVNTPSRDPDPAFIPLEPHAAAVLLLIGDDHPDAVGIGVFDAEIPVHIPEAVFWKLRFALNLDRPGVLGAHAPVGDVEMVAAPAGDHAGAVVGNTEPTRPGADAVLGVHACLGIRGPGSRSEPHLVVQVLRHRHLRHRAATRVRAEPDLDRVEFPDPAVPDQFAGLSEVPFRPLLASDQKDPAVPTNRVAQYATLLNRESQRFLQEDVLAGPGRFDSRQGVPMVRRGDLHRVDVTPSR